MGATVSQNNKFSYASMFIDLHDRSSASCFTFLLTHLVVEIFSSVDRKQVKRQWENKA